MASNADVSAKERKQNVTEKDTIKLLEMIEIHFLVLNQYSTDLSKSCPGWTVAWKKIEDDLSTLLQLKRCRRLQKKVEGK